MNDVEIIRAVGVVVGSVGFGIVIGHARAVLVAKFEADSKAADRKAEADEKFIGSISPPYYAPVPNGGVQMYGANSILMRAVIGPTGNTSPFDAMVSFTYEAAAS